MPCTKTACDIASIPPKRHGKLLVILQAQLPPLQAIWEAIFGGRLPHLKQFWGVRLRDWKQFRYRPGAFGANIGSWLLPLQAILDAFSRGCMYHLKQFSKWGFIHWKQFFSHVPKYIFPKSKQSSSIAREIARCGEANASPLHVPLHTKLHQVIYIWCKAIKLHVKARLRIDL